jgi:hypothetical protein
VELQESDLSNTASSLVMNEKRQKQNLPGKVGSSAKSKPASLKPAMLFAN